MILAFLRRFIPGQKLAWWERYFTLILVAAVVIFMIMSITIGLSQSVWFDEAYSIMLAKQPTDQLMYLTTVDTHPPLYYLLLKAWAGLFGWSEFALRSLSVIAAGGAVAVAGLLVRRMFGVRTALIALPFISLMPLLLRYGFEIRMYAVASLIGIAATYVLVRALQSKPGRDQWVLYGTYAVLVALGVFTLYYTVLLWVAHVVWLAWMTRREGRSIIKSEWVKAFGVSVFLFLPWLPAFISQIGNGSLAAISQPLTIDNLVGIVSFAFVYQPSWQLSAAMSLVVLFVIVSLVCFSIRAFKLVSSKQRPYLVLFALYMAVPIVILTIVSLIKPMYVERYLAHILIGGGIFVGCIVAINLAKATSKIRVTAGALVAVLLIGVAQLSMVGNFNFQRLQTPMIEQAAATMGDCANGATVFAADPYVAIELNYYLPDCQIHFYSETATLKGGYAALSDSPLHIDDPARELASSRKIYFVYYDQPKHTMPGTVMGVSVASYDSLHVATFSAE